MLAGLCAKLKQFKAKLNVHTELIPSFESRVIVFQSETKIKRESFIQHETNSAYE